jgi:hypothetical protein
MSLDPDELGYFIAQIGDAAQVIGLTPDEANVITSRMSTGLTFRCKPPSAITPGGIPGPQSICTDEECPLAPESDCTAYDFNNGTSPDPTPVNGAVIQPSSASSTTPVSSATSSASSNPSSSNSKSSNSKIIPIAVGVAVPVGVIAIALIAFLIWRQKRKMSKLEDRLTQIEGEGTNHGAPSEIMSYMSTPKNNAAALNGVRGSQSTLSPNHERFASLYHQPPAEFPGTPEMGSNPSSPPQDSHRYSGRQRSSVQDSYRQSVEAPVRAPSTRPAETIPQEME